MGQDPAATHFTSTPFGMVSVTGEAHTGGGGGGAFSITVALLAQQTVVPGQSAL
jgi:hypothetical protein